MQKLLIECIPMNNGVLLLLSECLNLLMLLKLSKVLTLYNGLIVLVFENVSSQIYEQLNILQYVAITL